MNMQIPYLLISNIKSKLYNFISVQQINTIDESTVEDNIVADNVVISEDIEEADPEASNTVKDCSGNSTDTAGRNSDNDITENIAVTSSEVTADSEVTASSNPTAVDDSSDHIDNTAVTNCESILNDLITVATSSR